MKSKELELRRERRDGEILLARGRNEKKKGKEQRRRSKSRAKSKKCYTCNKEGHFRKDCPQNKTKDKSEQGKEESESANYMEGYDSAEVLMVSDFEVQNEWILDSGCSYHMTPNREYLIDFKDIKGSKVLLGNNEACVVQGVDSVRIKAHDGQEKILTEVRYVPQLRRNLISLGELDRSGFSYKSEKGSLKVYKGSLLKLKGVLKNGLYILDGTTIVGETTVVSDAAVKNTEVWHKSLGHVSEGGLNALFRQGLLGEQKLTDLPLCEHCVLSKSTRVKFGKGKHTTGAILEYVHSDLWGPARVATLRGARYFFTLIDDYSRKVWIFLLKQKSEAFSKFKEWKLLIENKTGRKLKCLRTDNGLEFLSNEFKDFCKVEGVERHLIVRMTPQQNGLAERYNQTILERVRCLLSNAKLPKTFWGEAAATACYLINRCPSTAIGLKTPQELWTGKPPDLSNLKVFGCTAFAHVKEGKLDPRAKKCIFLGYPHGVKGYKLWSHEEGKGRCLVSRDVVFNESEMPYSVMMEHDANKESQELQSYEIELEETSENSEPPSIQATDTQNIEAPENTSSSDGSSGSELNNQA